MVLPLAAASVSQEAARMKGVIASALWISYNRTLFCMYIYPFAANAWQLRYTQDSRDVDFASVPSILYCMYKWWDVKPCRRNVVCSASRIRSQACGISQTWTITLGNKRFFCHHMNRCIFFSIFCIRILVSLSCIYGDKYNFFLALATYIVCVLLSNGTG